LLPVHRSRKTFEEREINVGFSMSSFFKSKCFERAGIRVAADGNYLYMSLLY
jgi:hypothetical protein